MATFSYVTCQWRKTWSATNGQGVSEFRNLGENRAELNGGYECHSSECLMEEPPAIHNDKSYPSIANRLWREETNECTLSFKRNTLSCINADKLKNFFGWPRFLLQYPWYAEEEKKGKAGKSSSEEWRQRKCDHRQSGFSSRRKKKSSWHIALFCSSGVKIALLSVQLGNFDSFFGVARLESAGKVCMSHFVWFSPQSVVNRCPKLLSN